jgi:hypothetical protein
MSEFVSGAQAALEHMSQSPSDGLFGFLRKMLPVCGVALSKLNAEKSHEETFLPRRAGAAARWLRRHDPTQQRALTGTAVGPEPVRSLARLAAMPVLLPGSAPAPGSSADCSSINPGGLRILRSSRVTPREIRFVQNAASGASPPLSQAEMTGFAG